MRYVRYVGLAHVRQITADDWRRSGLNGDTVQWDAFNGFAVPLDQFNDDQIRKAIESDSSFIITGDEDEEFEPDTTTATVPMTPQQLEGPRVDILGGDGAANASTGRTEAFPDGVNDNATPGGDAPTTTTTGRGSGKD
jgi:hypothetical protein